MKSEQEIKKHLFAILTELQSGTVKGDLKIRLQGKLDVLYDILGEDVPEEYWEQIETAIYE